MSMTKKQKKVLYRILLAAALLILLHFLPLTGIWRTVAYLIPYLVIGYDILRKAGMGILHGQVFDENFLMAVATVGAMLLGDYPEGSAVMLFYQVGELFQSYAVGKSRKSISDLMNIRPDVAFVERDGKVEEVDPDEVAVGEVIVVRPGEKVPLDGVVLEGSSSLDTAALTGESVPRDVTPGDPILSACVNTDGLLRVTVTKEFGESTVSKILDLVENSSLKKAKAEDFITKFAAWYTPSVCVAALLLALVPPLFMGGWITWITRALTFLVISCPCALVISIPLSFFGGIGGASRQGILIKGANYLEVLSQTRTAVFDKTGTLTKGVFAVTKLLPADGVAEADLVTTAALAESWSNHPISKSLRAACTEKLDTDRATDAQEQAGHGVSALVDGKKVLAGNSKLMDANGISYQPCTEVGTVVYVAREGEYLGCIVIADVVKESSKQAIQALQSAGIKCIMLTGDSKAVADAVGAQLGLDEVHSELMPGDKVTEVENLLAAQQSKERLAFVGDGLNDAPVLTRADIGIAMGAMGSDAAIEAADVVLMDDDPAKIATAMSISRKCLRIVWENIIFALAIKVLVLVLGALGIANMWAAIFADVGVMVLAVLNATRMLHTKVR